MGRARIGFWNEFEALPGYVWEGALGGLDDMCNNYTLDMVFGSLEQRIYNMDEDEYVDGENQVKQAPFGLALFKDIFDVADAEM